MTSFVSTGQLRAFRPLGNNKTVNLVVSAASQNLTIPDQLGTRSIRIVNSGTNLIFVEFGTATATAATSMPLLGNTVEVFTFANDITALQIISTGAGNTVYVTYGEGL